MRQLKISDSITNRNNRSLSLYLNEVSKFELISADEEVSLAEKIREGDQLALERLTKANLRFVISVAKQYQHQGLVLEDLINEGNAGLVKAARRFDETKGFKFISYAVWWIRQSIMSAISIQSRAVRLPGNQISNLIKLRRSQAEMEQRLEREPSVEELAVELGTTTDRIIASFANAERQLSIDAPSVFSEEERLLDSLASSDPATDQQLIQDSLFLRIDLVLKKLSSRERQILTMFYGLSNSEPQTLDEIAYQLKLTPERIRQLKTKALLHIKNSSSGRDLLQHL
ncbi:MULTISPECIES: sigma-70 family RNA polymerase sigma factor [Olivibacter]|jgi:RNA polymerase primary sigma factor|uniref:RNA polymerase sigma factor RpoD/SigA n=2 Tax=Olivibacter TaxID=376469 RepID=A0ABV6HQY3_9SPHI|nr:MULTISPECIES: RNA polymerase sigma factor RpoD/SigA [Olivibacter]MCL4642046.1 RNA polymerase sigma factor RpoD/SigA [Olivibacter sp. UJ_SKK_5.1]QEL03072.1 RNA polymerase sigma factor RpoD/SigA [Olivibacter sp. LS-1]